MANSMLALGLGTRCQRSAKKPLAKRRAQHGQMLRLLLCSSTKALHHQTLRGFASSSRQAPGFRAVPVPAEARCSPRTVMCHFARPHATSRCHGIASRAPATTRSDGVTDRQQTIFCCPGPVHLLSPTSCADEPRSG